MRGIVVPAPGLNNRKGELIGGADMASTPVSKRGIGPVPQIYALFPHLKVVRNVTFVLQIMTLPDAKIKIRIVHGF